jgi:hypothetical protein
MQSLRPSGDVTVNRSAIPQEIAPRITSQIWGLRTHAILAPAHPWKRNQPS